jgi:hypothetical protein
VGDDDEAIQLGHRAMYHRRPLLRRQYLIGTAHATALAAVSEGRSGGDGSPAAVKEMVIL